MHQLIDLINLLSLQVLILLTCQVMLVFNRVYQSDDILLQIQGLVSGQAKQAIPRQARQIITRFFFSDDSSLATFSTALRLSTCWRPWITRSLALSARFLALMVMW